jgi:hypothetical protein
MATATTTSWRIAGEELAHCNCAWGCPCQFNALPTTGRCEAVLGWEIREGHFGSTDLSGTRFARLYSWPGPIHEGNGTRQMILDESMTDEQRAALEALDRGEAGGAYFEIFAQVCPTRHDTVVAPIELSIDREARTGSIRITDVVDTRAEPILNPVTGEPHRARIDLPEGFEYKQAEIGNTVFARVNAGINFELENTYAQLNPFDWTNG